MTEQKELLMQLDAIQENIWKLKEVERATKLELDFLEKQKEEKFLKLLDLKDKIVQVY